ncbi:MAG: glycoside hydrolase family 88 protein [Puniceicoccales bacterium]|nr:glycoside hydrolase family 88 protein [Puniceicoccales bacterium]
MTLHTPFSLAVALLLGSLVAAPDTGAQTPLPAPSQVLADMHRVADWQLANRPAPDNRRPSAIDWTFAAYYAGHMALAELSPDSAKYLDAFREVGKKHNWQLAPRKSTRYHADDHAIAQSYIEYALRTHDEAAIRPAQTFFDFLLASPPAQADNLDFNAKNNRFLEKWSWCDALFMAPPALARLYEYTGDRRYLDLMNNRWWHTTDYLYDKEEHLYYRDSRYFNRREANGKKVFWGRGNGWVLGGTARVLQSIPADYPDRPRYEQLFRDMCARFLALQGADGLWRTSLLDPAAYPAPETSSTGFATYAFAWGVNAGLLDPDAYWPAALKGWRGLLSHVNADGRLGSCQPIGADPRKIKETDTDLYGSGAFLLAGAEIYKALLLRQNQHGTVTVKNATDAHRRWATIAIPTAKLKSLTGTDDPNEVLVFDALAPRLRDTQAWKNPIDHGTVKADTLLFQATLPPNTTRRFILVRKPADFKGPEPIKLVHARFAPERMDDYLWENDRIAHRAYGPALITKEGTNTSGIDIFMKSTAALVMDKFYKRGNYHKDHGEGLDAYDVGQSRGIGGTVTQGSDGKWYPTENFVTHTTFATGPLRAAFRLSYASRGTGQQTTSEDKLVFVDAGSDFTRIVTTYNDAIHGEKNKTHIGVGVVQTNWPGRKKHATKAYVLDDKPENTQMPLASGKNWLADWQPNTGNNGITGVAVIVPDATEVRPVEGHWLVVSTRDSTNLEPHTAYIGGGWSKGWYPTKESWLQSVENFRKTLETPLEISYEK